MGGVKTVTFFFIVSYSFIGVCCTCSEGQWYDIDRYKCTPCTECGRNKFVVFPCNRYRDTVCANFADLNFHFIKLPMERVRPTHEVEFQGMTNWAPVYNQENLNENGTRTDNPVVLGLAVGCVIAVAFVLTILVVISCHFRRRRNENYHSQTRARLFSRDRLNTTEYKHTLAFLDRKLAMDEILEKKRAILAPSDETKGNQYVDDVFVDLNAVPLTDREGARLLSNV